MDIIDIDSDTIDAEVLESMAVTNDHFKFINFIESNTIFNSNIVHYTYQRAYSS